MAERGGRRRERWMCTWTTSRTSARAICASDAFHRPVQGASSAQRVPSVQQHDRLRCPPVSALPPLLACLLLSRIPRANVSPVISIASSTISSRTRSHRFPLHAVSSRSSTRLPIASHSPIPLLDLVRSRLPASLLLSLSHLPPQTTSSFHPLLNSVPSDLASLPTARSLPRACGAAFSLSRTPSAGSVIKCLATVCARSAHSSRKHCKAAQFPAFCTSRAQLAIVSPAPARAVV